MQRTCVESCPGVRRDLALTPSNRGSSSGRAVPNGVILLGRSLQRGVGQLLEIIPHVGGNVLAHCRLMPRELLQPSRPEGLLIYLATAGEEAFTMDPAGGGLGP